MASLLSIVSIYILVTVVNSKPLLEGGCPQPPNSDNTSVTYLFGGRAAIITCENSTQQMALCVDGKWTSSVFCSEECTHEEPNQVETSPLLSRREKRNTGKYQELKRRVKVQRKLRAGLLETSIDDTTPTIYRVHPRGNVYLACRVENLGAHSITWTRMRDMQILAIDTSVISPDSRISATYEEKTQTWFLMINRAKESDGGRYICRVTTKGPLQRVLTLQMVPADQPLHAPIRQEDHDIDFVLRNITALWEEVSDIRQEIVRHLHEGHKEQGHDSVKEEVETLHHEHHVHHLHHPHKGHNEHHSDELLMHLKDAHGHLDDHTAGQPVHGHLHGHGPSHDHLHGPPKTSDHVHDHDDDSHEHHDDHDHDHDGHDHDGHDHDHDGHDHDHDGHDHDGHDHDHDGHDHDHDGHDHDHHDHDHDHDEVHPGKRDEHDDHGLHSHEDEHEYGHEHGHDHVSDDVDHHGHHDHDDHTLGDKHGDHGAPGMARPGLPPLPGSLTSGRHPNDPWMHASCTLKPNKDVPTSNVNGGVVISQRKDMKGPVYFDIHLSGVDVASLGRTHGFHIHELPVTDESCGSTGGHFNPTGTTHGAPTAEVRHVGDLGNVEVNESGELHGYIIDDAVVAFNGANSIIGKSIVVHAGVDDLGEGGDEGSLATGNAGGRLACCTIYMGATLGREDLVNFRIKG